VGGGGERRLHPAARPRFSPSLLAQHGSLTFTAHSSQGHLLIVSPGFETLAETFFSSTSLVSTPDAQADAYQDSSIPKLLESFVLPPTTNTSVGPGAPLGRSTTGGTIIDSPDQKPVRERDPDRMSTTGWSPSSAINGADPAIGATSSFATSPPFNSAQSPLNFIQPQNLNMPSASSYSPSMQNGSLHAGAFAGGLGFGGSGGAMSSGLHALASVASHEVPGIGNERKRLRAMSVSRTDGSSPGGTSSFRGIEGYDPAGSNPPIPPLPTETIRNHLLDIYFHQIVHPIYPMLDKAKVLRWSAHLPAGPLPSQSPAVGGLPPELYLAIFASVAAYLPPDQAVKCTTVEGFAGPARAHLFDKIGEPTVESVQAAVLLALVDWGQGELSRAWTLSAMALALAVNLNQHVIDRNDPQSRSSPGLQTFHCVLIIHTALSLRLLRPPLSVLEDYDVPLPSSDGSQNFELWRSEKTPDELRAERNVPGAAQKALSATSRRAHAVRASTLAVFSKMASLCAIGTSVIRWGVCPRRGHGQGLAAGDKERQELVQSLFTWERDLPPDLRLGEAQRGVDKIDERAPAVVEMHLLYFCMLLRLGPHPTLKSMSFDPTPGAIVSLASILSKYDHTFSFLRVLPGAVELALHSLSTALFLRADYAPQQHDLPLQAYAELGLVLPVAKTSYAALSANIDAHRRQTHAAPSPGTSGLAPFDFTQLAPPINPFDNPSFNTSSTGGGSGGLGLPDPMTGVPDGIDYAMLGSGGIVGGQMSNADMLRSMGLPVNYDSLDFMSQHVKPLPRQGSGESATEEPWPVA